MSNKTLLYFAVVGKNPGLSLYELEMLGAKFLDFRNSVQQFTMSEEQFNRFENVNGGIIKRGRVVSPEELPALLEGVKIIGVSSQKLGRTAKELGVRRFKEIDLQKTDLEIKRKGKEIINVEGEIGFITGYQRIDRFEIIDFERPVRGMQIGMMPAKLTQTLVGIGVGIMKNKDGAIFDPFCGFGTTGYVANMLGFDTICSDINPTPMKQNLDWREQSEFATDKRITVFKHDVLEPFTQPFLSYAGVVVTEGRLGPIFGQKAINQLTRIQLSEKQESIYEIYSGFLKNLHDAQPGLPLVITYPQWTFIAENMAHRFINFAKDLGYEVEQAGDVYKRKKQFVGRRVLVIRPV